MRKPPIGHVPIGEESPVNHRLAWWLENSTLRFMKRLFNGIKENVRDLLSFSLNDWIEDLEEGLIDIAQPGLDYLDTIDDIPVWLRTIINRTKSGEHAAGLIGVAAIVLALFEILKQGISGVFAPMLEHGINRVVRATYPQVGDILSLRNRALLSDNEAKSLLHGYGFSNELSTNILSLRERPPNDNELTMALWRKIFTPVQVESYLQSNGLSPTAIGLWFSTRQVIPSTSEIISIAVREGFNDVVSEQFGYNEAFPAELKEYGEKQGLSEYWTRRLWRAHWRLPSPNQVYEMLHRKIINDDILELYLKAADYPIYWRNKLKQLSYNPVTRVDVRRMFAVNVLSEQEVFDRYLALGYSVTDAEKMTLWTVAEYAEKERELTKTDILKMYKDSLLTENETSAYLSALGYKIPDVALLMARQDLAREAAYEKELVKTIKDMYLTNKIDRGAVYNELGAINPPSGFVENLLQLWDLEKIKRMRRPSNTDLKLMGKRGILSREQLTNELRDKGYNDVYINYYLALWIGE